MIYFSDYEILRKQFFLCFNYNYRAKKTSPATQKMRGRACRKALPLIFMYDYCLLIFVFVLYICEIEHCSFVGHHALVVLF